MQGKTRPDITFAVAEAWNRGRARHFFLAAVIAIAGLGSHRLALAAQAPDAVIETGDTLPLDPNVRVGILDNGLRYYVRANGRPEKRAELRLAVNAGSILETDSQRGLAHFVEHMAFNGTENFAKQELVAYLESIGMRFGADLNAYTSFDETVYMLTVPTDSGDFLERGILILEDWAQNQVFDPVEVEKERGVVIEEWRQGQGASERMRAKMFPVLLKGSRYAERLPIGERTVLESFDPAELRAYYDQWYRPDQMAVIAVGEFDAAAVERLIRERFATLEGEATERPLYSVPDHDETLASIVTDAEALNSSVTVYHKLPVRDERTVSDYRRSLVEQLYNAILNERLSELAQKPDAPYLGASSGNGNLLRTSAVYLIGAGVADGGIERGLEAVLTEAERVARHGFTASELERAKTNMIRSYEMAYEEREKTNSATYAAEYTRAFLEREPIPGITFEYRIAQQFLPGITLEEVNGLSDEWMSERNRVVVAQAPEKADVTVPPEDALLAVFDAVKRKPIEPYEDIVAAGTLVPRPPTPGTIVAETRHDDIDTIEWTLSNGVRVFLKRTDFKDDELLFSASSPGGLSLAPDTQIVSALLATSAVAAGGVGEMTLVELQKALTGKAASVQPSISESAQGLSGSASPRDARTLFELIYLYVTAPREDPNAFQALRARFQAQVANRSASPEAVFSDTLQMTMSQYHPRMPLITSDRLDEWRLEESIAFYRERFADASDFTFAFVGNFDADSLRPLVLEFLGGLPSTQRADSSRDSGVRPPSGVVEKVVRKGIEPKSRTSIIFTGPFEYSRETRHVIGSLRDALEIELRDILREDLGGTYGVEVGQSTARDPWERYSFTIGFGAAPDRIEELAAAVFAHIEKVQAEGVSAETLAKIKEAQRRAHEGRLEQNAYWTAQLMYAAQIGEDPAAFQVYPELVDALTGDMLRDAATRYLSNENYVRVSLHPESGN